MIYQTLYYEIVVYVQVFVEEEELYSYLMEQVYRLGRLFFCEKLSPFSAEGTI